jgi:hypothetical protein
MLWRFDLPTGLRRGRRQGLPHCLIGGPDLECDFDLDFDFDFEFDVMFSRAYFRESDSDSRRTSALAGSIASPSAPESQPLMNRRPSPATRGVNPRRASLATDL